MVMKMAPDVAQAVGMKELPQACHLGVPPMLNRDKFSRIFLTGFFSLHPGMAAMEPGDPQRRYLSKALMNRLMVCGSAPNVENHCVEEKYFQTF